MDRNVVAAALPAHLSFPLIIGPSHLAEFDCVPQVYPVIFVRVLIVSFVELNTVELTQSVFDRLRTLAHINLQAFQKGSELDQNFAQVLASIRDELRPARLEEVDRCLSVRRFNHVVKLIENFGDLPQCDPFLSEEQERHYGLEFISGQFVAATSALDGQQCCRVL